MNSITFQYFYKNIWPGIKNNQITKEIDSLITLNDKDIGDVFVDDIAEVSAE